MDDAANGWMVCWEKRREEGGRPLSAAVAVVIAQIEAAEEERGGMLRFTSGVGPAVHPRVFGRQKSRRSLISSSLSLFVRVDA